MVLVFLGGILVVLAYVVVCTPDQRSSRGSALLRVRFVLGFILRGVIRSAGRARMSSYLRGKMLRLVPAPLFLRGLIVYLLLVLLCVSQLIRRSKGLLHK